VNKYQKEKKNKLFEIKAAKQQVVIAHMRDKLIKIYIIFFLFYNF